jgi:cytidyltransferase-like protein
VKSSKSANPHIRTSAHPHIRISANPHIRKSAINIKMKKAIIVSGYFNPIHKGHIEYFNNAKALGDYLIVIVNSDKQRALKGSKEFQLEDERVFIVSNIKSVDQVFLSIDEDRTVCATIQHIQEQLHHEYQLAFANGGDQNNNSIPEVPVCEKLGIALLDGLGDKIQSSSWLLK